MVATKPNFIECGDGKYRSVYKQAADGSSFNGWWDISDSPIFHNKQGEKLKPTKDDDGTRLHAVFQTESGESHCFGSHAMRVGKKTDGISQEVIDFACDSENKDMKYSELKPST